MSMYAQDSYHVSKNIHDQFRPALGADFCRSRQIRPRRFVQHGGFFRRSGEHRASDRALRAFLPGRSRAFRRRTGTGTIRTSRRASAWCGILMATAATPCALARRFCTTRPKPGSTSAKRRIRLLAMTSMSGSTGTLTNPWAGYPGGNPFPAARESVLSANSARTSICRSTRSRLMSPQWNATYQRQFGKNWLASSAIWGIRPRTSGSPRSGIRRNILGDGIVRHCGRQTYNPCSSTEQHESAAAALSGQSHDRLLLREHRYHGRRRGGAL